MRDEQHFFGLYPAIVTDVVDRDRLGRIEVRFPWLGAAGADVRSWATLLTPYADDDQGFAVLPSVGSQVVVGFEAGSVERPYVVGACWNGEETMPITPTRPNDKRVFKSRSGGILEFDDAAGAEKVTVRTGRGHRVVLDDGRREITITHADGPSVTLTTSGIRIEASATVDVHAVVMNVHAPTAVFDGTVTCTTLVASGGVVSPSYTPGAGNVW